MGVCSPKLFLGEAHETDEFEGVAAAERVVGGREALAARGSERLVYLVGRVERDEVREVAPGELSYF